MLKGLANTGGNDPPEDPHGIVVALSQLSKSLDGDEAVPIFTAAAEMAAALLRVPRVIVFAQYDASGMDVAGSHGLDVDDGLVAGALAIARIAVLSCRPVFHPDPADKTSTLSQCLQGAGIPAAISVPMRVGEVSVGAIVALSSQPHTFLGSDVELLHVVASRAALATWRVDSIAAGELAADNHEELIRVAERKIRELSLLNQVSEAMRSTLDLDQLLDIALEQSLAIVGADAGSLMLVNEETGRLEIEASRGLAQRLKKNTSQRVGKSIAGWVAEHGESVVVTDASRDDRFDMPFVRREITSSASVPLKTKGTVIGVLNVNTVHSEKTFDERDLELLGTVANQMAVAIENARLYARVNRRTNQLDSLLQISKTITSTLNLDEVLHRLSEEVCKLFQLDVCVLLLTDELTGRLRLGHGAGLRSRRTYVYYDLAAPIALRTLNQDRKQIVRDISRAPLLRTDISKTEGLKAAICLPLRNRGRIVGMAAGFARDTRSFAKSQLDIMRPLGELAGVAIQNARIYRKKYKIAEMLQQRLLPSNIPEIDGLDIGHVFLPARDVGGDYYDFVNAGRNRVGIVVADVSGSDVEAAEYTTMGKHILRTYACDTNPLLRFLPRQTISSAKTHQWSCSLACFTGLLTSTR